MNAEKTVHDLLRLMLAKNASDLFITAGFPPAIKIDGKIAPVSNQSLTPAHTSELARSIMNERQWKDFEATNESNFAISPPEIGRFRVNVFVQQGRVGVVMRTINTRIPKMEELNLPPILKDVAMIKRGLVIFVGGTGTGKSTSLAAMVGYRNENAADHIITVEDPIEVVQPAKGCNVTQREVGPHTKSFAAALKGALREDPDIIVIGELRDLETIEMAITASETGHLVIGTMHTSDAATTLNRLLDVFPPSQQTQIRASVAESLRGIVCQRLLPSPDGSLVLACEILVSNIAIQNLIREGKSTGLRNTMETGVKEGMCLMDNVVFSLHHDGKISSEVALANITNRVLRHKIT